MTGVNRNCEGTATREAEGMGTGERGIGQKLSGRRARIFSGDQAVLVSLFWVVVTSMAIP